MFADTGPDAVRLGRRAFALLADLPAPQALDAAQFLNLAFFLGERAARGRRRRSSRSGRPRWVDPDQERP